MTLQPFVRLIAEVPEPIRQFYKPHDGGFALCLGGVPDGYVSAADLEISKQTARELRHANITIAKVLKKCLGIQAQITELPTAIRAFGAEVEEFKEWRARYEGVDPDEYHALKALSVAAASPAPIERQAPTELERESTDVAALIRRKEFEMQVAVLGLRAGVQRKMIAPFVNHVLNCFRDADGQFIATTSSGAPLFSKRNIVEPISVAEWTDDQVLIVPGFFESAVVKARSAAAE